MGLLGLRWRWLLGTTRLLHRNPKKGICQVTALGAPDKSADEQACDLWRFGLFLAGQRKL